MAATKMVFHHMVLIFHPFKDLEDLWARRLPDDFHEDFQTTSTKTSRRLPDDFQEVFETTSKKSSRRLPGSLLTESSPMSPFHNRSERLDFGRPMGSLLGSLLKYNALEDFKEVFQTTSRKSSDGIFFHIKWSPSLSL
ncbi:hypothetical protein F2Q68_00014324 [Brassica cretica]|uniref:Uncharacterized protein n=1 Tax=Brassica cretica TaxID=69181 RepID=A0A8S9HBW8_BRACR|nr:hypothetical protein F2Q68_00014324 [Brassica cretica]